MKQRIIKFRAWNPKENKMWHSDFCIEHNGSVIWWQFTEGYNDYSRAVDDEVELMQFTGLKDKNGKEIYEGDIIKVEDAFETGIFSYFKIEFFECGFAYDLISNENRTGRDNFEFLNKENFNEDSEVIGNIYENPELLNQRGLRVNTREAKE